MKKIISILSLILLTGFCAKAAKSEDYVAEETAKAAEVIIVEEQAVEESVKEEPVKKEQIKISQEEKNINEATTEKKDTTEKETALEWKTLAFELIQCENNIYQKNLGKYILKECENSWFDTDMKNTRVAIADLNHDGEMDVITCVPTGHRYDEWTNIYIANGTGYEVYDLLAGCMTGYSDSYLFFEEFSYIGSGEVYYLRSRIEDLNNLSSFDEGLLSSWIPTGYIAENEETEKELREKYQDRYKINELEVSKDEFDAAYNQFSNNYVPLVFFDATIENLRFQFSRIEYKKPPFNTDEEYYAWIIDRINHFDDYEYWDWFDAKEEYKDIVYVQPGFLSFDSYTYDINGDGREDLVLSGPLGVREVIQNHIYLTKENGYDCIETYGGINRMTKNYIEFDTGDYEYGPDNTYTQYASYDICNITPDNQMHIVLNSHESYMYKDSEDEPVQTESAYYKEDQPISKEEFEVYKNNFNWDLDAFGEN